MKQGSAQGDLHNLQWILFVLGLCCLMASPTLSNRIKCDPKIHYTVKNKTTGETLKCVLVRHCPPGKEPKIPCGSDIHINDIIGFCKPCDNGTYSSTSGPEPCQICHGANCSNDQFPQGTCSTMQDNSFCRCKDGFAMNEDGTACEYRSQNNPTKYSSSTTKKTTTKKAFPEQPARERPPTKKPTMGKPSTQRPSTQKPSTPRPSTQRLLTQRSSTQRLSTQRPSTQRLSTQRPSTQKPSTQRPSTQRPTTGIGMRNVTLSAKKTANKITTSLLANDRKDHNDVIKLVLTVALPLLVVFILLVIIYKVYKRCGNRGNAVVLLNKEEIINLSQQEEAKESDSPVNKVHCSETFEGLRGSHPDRSVSSDIPASPNSNVPNMASYRKLENDASPVTMKVDFKIEAEVKYSSR